MTSDILCSLGGAKTFLDTNLVLLSGPSAYQLSGVFLLPDRRVPANWIPDVIHEGIHHWCLDSPLGVGLTLNRAALMEDCLGPAGAHAVEVRISRHRALVEALRPFMEGLACFGEFDLYPAGGNLRVDPLLWAERIQGDNRGRESDLTNIEDVLRAFIREMRIEQDYVANRKDTLFATSLDPRSTGGYLLGYLYVKGIQRRLLMEFDFDVDTELLLAYLRAYVFSDYLLASKLLASPKDQLDYPDLVSRLNDRLQSLAYSKDLATRIREFNEAHAHDPPVDHLVNSSIDTTPELAAGYLAQRGEHFERLDSEPTADDDDRNTVIRHIRGIATRNMRNRAWVCVASAPCDLTVTAGRISVRPPDQDATAAMLGWEPPMISGPTTRADAFREDIIDADHNGRGSLECWVSARGGALLVMATKAGVHGVIPLFILDLAAAKDFLRHATSNGSAIEVTSFLRSVTDGLIEEQPWHHELQSDINATVRSAMTQQLDLVSDLMEMDDDARTMLIRNSIYSVLGTADLVRAAVGVGLLQSVGFADDYGEDTSADTIRKVIVGVQDLGLVAGVELADVRYGRLWV